MVPAWQQTCSGRTTDIAFKNIDFSLIRTYHIVNKIYIAIRPSLALKRDCEHKQRHPVQLPTRESGLICRPSRYVWHILGNHKVTVDFLESGVLDYSNPEVSAAKQETLMSPIRLYRK